jgi:enterochelin esterase family protein
VAGGFGANSELAMPGFVQPWEIIVKPSIPHGRTEVRSIYSAIRGISYSVRVYLPPGYDTSTDSFPSVYFQDGSDYVGLASAVTVLDNLIDSQKIRPVIGVFVTPTNRNEEYAGATRTNYRLFFVKELVPLIDSVYRTYSTPDMRVVLGDSYGGNISALISWYHPDIFGNCGLHSGAFQPNGYEAYNLILNGPPKPDSIRYVSVWGTYEGSLTSNMRTLKDSLINKGYNIRWQLRHEGHSWGLWRATIDFMLEYFFPFVTGTGETAEIPSTFQLEQNYPNPFNPTTVIRYSLVVSGYVTLKVYDITGRQVAVLVNGYVEAGRHDVPFDATGLASGMYVYRLTGSGNALQNATAARKMLFVK